MTKWFLYVVECSDSTYYTGITTSLDRRILEHNFSTKKGAKYTRSRRPVKLIYSEECIGRSDASKKEYNFKRKTRKQKTESIIESKWIKNDN